MDKYSQELARRLPVKQIPTRRYLSLRQSLRLMHVIQREKDIVHLPNQHLARYALLRRRPFIVTVHDIARFHFGFDSETPLERLMLKLDVLGIRRASHVIATSRNTRKDVVEHLGVPEERTSLVYNGMDCGVFQPRAGESRNGVYILYVGSERPRKNLGRLFEAFAELKREFPDLKLVKVGPSGRSTDFRRDVMLRLVSLGIAADVVFVDYVEESELAEYYRSAALLAYPSLYEGFGLPPLEAMCSGCPVVTTNTSSLPEVVGDAGMMVDPHDTAAWVEAMRRVLTDGVLRDEMIRKGLERSRMFSWDKTAAETAGVYRRVAVACRWAGEECLGAAPGCNLRPVPGQRAGRADGREGPVLGG